MTSTGASRTPRAIPFGKYLLLERLHVGSATEVFLAKTFGVEGFQKFVALKRMRGHLAHDAAATQRFIDEAKLLGALGHAHITPIYELGKVGPTHYTVMEHVWGQSLKTIIERRAGRREAPVGMAAFVGARLCDALHYAHTRRTDGVAAPVYHGNLEPSNVLVSYEGTIKLIDFALPGAAGDDADALLDGRFAYRSPEQLAGSPLDPRSEVFSVGACVYELLTGRRPDDEGRARPAPAGSEAEKSLLALLTRCMARDRRTRPESTAELQAEFLRSLSIGGQPFTTSRAAEWMRAEFDETLERSKRRLNLYAALRSPEDIDSIRPPASMEDDPFANEPTVITEPAFEEEAAGAWDDAPTQIYFSSDALSSSERPSFAITSTLSSSVKLAPNALTPEPEEQRRERKRRRDSAKKTQDATGPNPIVPRDEAAPPAAGVSTVWYIAGAFALIVIALVGWFATQQSGEGQIEIREREGRPAEAWVDGVMRGQTPLRLEHVGIGTRRVELRSEGLEPVASDILVRPNVTALVELSVVPREQPDPNRPGVLILTTVPWAHVHLDGRPTGRRTPIPDLQVSPGRHLLRLVADDGRSIEEEIFVRPGESLRIVRRFEP
ncbi:MAG: serine/threonine protein kinase [Sandaracinaceae bacterium]|nr:serine/threonine protein kinase [Sandaracinaceae bacterium]MBK6810996.1 serine/threonine protein kinase [Sandaracinaceae bacterium]MBK7155454.1 serine/threonine protein kinase [Sandaracinaceae bacterium]MBK7777178.1 serine/threonine protein kinase [Sandaracinaceae bacterium]MBK8410276.1 serine/threonine protein kinase [Sandaracinaceae bacterium]